MAQSGQRKCLCCGEFFDLDHRNRDRQRYCSAVGCRRASKAASQAAWLAQPQNSGYFRDPLHVARVQAWRAAHPGYGRGKPRKPPALQDSLITQVTDTIEECPIRAEIPALPSPSALQDLLNAPLPILARLSRTGESCKLNCSRSALFPFVVEGSWPGFLLSPL